MSSNFIVCPVKDGLRRDQKPWAIPEDAFETLTNAYQFRGRVLRRQGYSLLGRLSTDGGTTFLNLPVMGLRTQEEFVIATQNLIAFDTQNAYSYSGTVFTLLPSVMPVTWSGANYQLFYSINYSGAFWATNSKPGLNGYIVSVFAGQAGAEPYTVNITATGNTFQLGDIIYLLNVTGAAAANNLRQGTVTATGAHLLSPSQTVYAHKWKRDNWYCIVHNKNGYWTRWNSILWKSKQFRWGDRGFLG